MNTYIYYIHYTWSYLVLEFISSFWANALLLITSPSQFYVRVCIRSLVVVRCSFSSYNKVLTKTFLKKMYLLSPENRRALVIFPSGRHWLIFGWIFLPDHIMYKSALKSIIWQENALKKDQTGVSVEKNIKGFFVLKPSHKYCIFRYLNIRWRFLPDKTNHFLERL